jgi:hypothetical protein
MTNTIRAAGRLPRPDDASSRLFTNVKPLSVGAPPAGG